MNDTINLVNNDSILVEPNCSKLYINVGTAKNEIVPWVSNDTFFTVVATLSIFIAGILINRLIKFLERIREKKRIRKYFRFQKKKVYTNLIPQLTLGYAKFYQVIDINNGIPQTPPLQATDDYKRLASSNMSELLYAFNYKTNVSRVINHVDFIIRILDLSEKYHSKVLLESDEIRTSIAEMFDTYLKRLYSYLDFEKHNDVNYASDKTWKFIEQKYLEYHENFDGKRKLTEVVLEIILPIKDAVIEVNYHKYKPLAEDIVSLSKTLFLKYSALDRLTNEIKGQYESFYKEIKKINDLETIKL